VVLATGSRDGPRDYPCDVPVLSATTVRAVPDGAVVVHDPVGDWVGVAEQLAAAGRAVALVTSDAVAGTQVADVVGVNNRLQRAGVRRELRSRLLRVAGGVAELEHVWTGERKTVPCAAVVDCGHRLPEDALWRARPQLPRAGDCVAPRTLHEAVREGRRAALTVEVAARVPAVVR
jgi:2,4-dienoyl-CoA reductase (NADPH2)